MIGTLWLILVLGGFIILGREAFQAAPHVSVRSWFPQTTQLSLDPRRLTTLVFVHPQCPCTRATLANLDRLQVETNDQLAVTLVFVLPPGVPQGWEQGALWDEANRMPGVRVTRDPDGVEARRFHVTTSGHVLVYATDGHLVYSGGITPGRGHEGDSPGEIAIIQLTKGPLPSDTIERPVFGCTLL